MELKEVIGSLIIKLIEENVTLIKDDDGNVTGKNSSSLSLVIKICLNCKIFYIRHTFFVNAIIIL